MKLEGTDGVRRRLLRGDALRLLFADGVGFDTWVERYANPPRVYFEGRALPLDELEAVLVRLERYAREDGVRLEWNGAVPAKKARASDDLG